jgi:hypothetical protein
MRRSSRKLFGSSFAYPIDYAASIAVDERALAQLTDPRLIAAAPHLDREIAEHPELASHRWCIWTLCVIRPETRAERMALFGLTEDDLRAMAYAREYCSGMTIDEPSLTAEIQPGDWQRGRALWAKWEKLDLMTETERRTKVKLHKARLARHKRNQERYG